MKTEVIHHKDVDAFDKDRTVWIGRPSKWGNPFVVKVDGYRDEVLVKYEEYIKSHPELLGALPELEGKVLVCYCRPRRCHGDVLVKLLNEQGLE